MAICAINTANVFKRNTFKNNDIQKCPCGDKKAAPIRDSFSDSFRDVFKKEIFKDSFECSCNKK